MFCVFTAVLLQPNGVGKLIVPGPWKVTATLFQLTPFTVSANVWRVSLTVRLEKFVTIQKLGPLLLCVFALPVNVTLTLVLLIRTPCRLPPPFRLMAKLNGVGPVKSLSAFPMVNCVPDVRKPALAVLAADALQFSAVSLVSVGVPKPGLTSSKSKKLAAPWPARAVEASNRIARHTRST